MTNLHLEMFFESRESIQHSNSDPSNNPNTELNSVPTEAQIRYKDHNNRHLEGGDDGYDYEVRKFLIGRAMLDPDAIVIPT